MPLFRCPGMSLLEMTVVIIVLLSLVTILLFGARSWKRGSDRTSCILNIQNVQKGVRGYSNLFGLSEGANVSGLRNKIIEFGFLESLPTCPRDGDYLFGSYSPTHGSDMIPPYGTLYMECSLAESDEHVPLRFADW